MLKFVLWDKKPYVLHEGDLSKGTAHYNGITWNENDIFVSANINTKYVIRVFDKEFKPIGILPNADLHETHQIYWLDSKLYVTNTGLNRIEILDNGYWFHTAWNKVTCDIDHINGIWSDGYKFYITQFANRGKPKKTSSIKICDMNFNQENELIVGNGIHNVYAENGIIHTLVSNTPQIFRIGSASIPLKNVDKGLIRGLARTKEFWYIGVSRWETEYNKRHVGDAVILQLDNEFNEIDRIVMPDFGPVYDIRVIDELDLAHNGITF